MAHGAQLLVGALGGVVSRPGYSGSLAFRLGHRRHVVGPDGLGGAHAKALTDLAMLVSGATMGAAVTPAAIAAIARYPASLLLLSLPSWPYRAVHPLARTRRRLETRRCRAGLCARSVVDRHGSGGRSQCLGRADRDRREPEAVRAHCPASDRDRHVRQRLAGRWADRAGSPGGLARSMAIILLGGLAVGTLWAGFRWRRRCCSGRPW